jgi:sialate O-acetylesterase
VLAVRVYDGMGEGGFRSPADSLWIAPDQGHDASSRLPLAGAWRFRATHPLPIPPGNPNNPNLACAFYNTFIHPLAPCAFRGAIWYQGESNSGNAWEYRELFPAMIQCWRDRWGRDFPFLWVQLASLGGPLGQPGDHDWAVVREAQSLALSLPKTAQVVSIDIGDPHDIHPRNKREVGRRLALAARAIEYGEKDLVYSGPVFAGMKVKGDTVRLRFRNVGGGLVAKDGPLSRFAIAGEDRRFVWGEAAIDGDTVVVRSPDVPEPVAVRYAWEIGPAGANLFNAEGLPASPFRTDDWPVATQPLPRRRSSDSPTLPSP